MLRKVFRTAICAVCLLALAAGGRLSAQGISMQEYNGLDKYLTQARPDGFSFAGVRAAEFLSIPVGARAIGLGSAYTAVCDDITAIWWNPAGLGFLRQREMMFNYVDYTMDLTYSYGAIAAPVADGRVVLGAFVGHLNIPETEITTIENPNGTGQYYKAYDLQIGGSLAYNFSDRFTAGLSAKYVHQDFMGNVGGSAFAVDGGAIYHTELFEHDIRFAFAVQNLGTNITMDGPNFIYEGPAESREDVLPTGYADYSDDPLAFSRRGTRQFKRLTHTYRLPTAVKVALALNVLTTEKLNLLAAGEIWRNSNMPLSYSFGGELNCSFDQITSGALRFGWLVQNDEFDGDTDEAGYAYLGDDPTLRGLSFGGGIKRQINGNAISFNYAYRNKGRLAADNFFTVSFGF